MERSHRADIDGIRAIAVALVVINHAFPAFLTGGFIGVDVFFVISGYLITGILTSDLSDNNFSLVRFYERRIRRLVPALVVMMAVTSIAASFVLLPLHLKLFFKSAFAASLFAANLFFAAQTDYFAPGSEVHWLLHTWSLAVEEQFYLAFPPLLWAVSRVGFSRSIVLAVVSAASLAFCVWQTYHAPTEAYYWPFSRAWELFAGGLLALAPNSERRQDAVGAIGLLAIILSAMLFSATTPFPGVAALAPTLGTVALLHSRSSVTARLLSLRPIVFVGMISYSLYLWHWPILGAIRYRFYDPSPALLASGVIASLIVAAVSWRYIEQPFRSRQFSGARVWRFGIITGLVVIVSTYAASRSDGWPQRFPFLAEHIPGREFYNERKCFLFKDQVPEDWRGSDCFLSEGFGTNALLWGDSYAAHYAPGIHDNPDAIGQNVLQYTLSSCPPSVEPSKKYDGCTQFNAAVAGIIQKYQIKTVFLSAQWDYHFSHDASSIGEIAKTAAWLREKGLSVYLLGQTPVFGFSDPRPFVLSNSRQMTTDVFARRMDDINPQLQSTGVAFINPSALLCDTRCPVFRNGHFMVIDQGHLSRYGSGEVVRLIGKILRSKHASFSSSAP